jgi:hypothetical protein
MSTVYDLKREVEKPERHTGAIGSPGSGAGSGVGRPGALEAGETGGCVNATAAWKYPPYVSLHGLYGQLHPLRL